MVQKLNIGPYVNFLTTLRKLSQFAPKFTKMFRGWHPLKSAFSFNMAAMAEHSLTFSLYRNFYFQQLLICSASFNQALVEGSLNMLNGSL